MSKKVMNFSMPEELHFQLETMALIKSCSMAAALRELIKTGTMEYLDNYEGPLTKEENERLDKIYSKKSKRTLKHRG